MTQQSSDPKTSSTIDLAIVGAGVSGLYTAWRLLCDSQQAEDRPSVEIFEESERVGGRLLTWMPMNTSGGLRAELGGMRFFKKQELVWSLLEKLGLSNGIRRFPAGGVRLLLRGHGTTPQAGDPTQRYMMPDEHKGKPADEILKYAIDKVLATDRNASVLSNRPNGQVPRDRKGWDEIKPYLTWDNRPLWKFGFWNLLSDILDSETYNYVSDAFGYYSLAANWNAAEAIQNIMLDFMINSPYMTLVQGFDALPRTLAEEVEAAGGKLMKKTRLVKFESLGDDGPWRLHLNGPDGKFTRDAAKLVLALPRRSLELLRPSESFDIRDNPDLRNLIRSVTPVPAFKLILFYPDRWWERLGITKGRSVCDLPIRQTYYFAPDSDHTHPQAEKCGLLMASYSDARAVDFWRGLPRPGMNLTAELLRLARIFGLDLNLTPPPRLNVASSEMLRHAKSQLASLHGIEEDQISDPVFGAFADWGTDPIGGAWNFWEPGIDVEATMKQIKMPLKDKKPVYIVGEAYCGAQGWVEGALTATEKTLQTHLDRKPPSWLREGYYLGW